jgi:hypothetical protein
MTIRERLATIRDLEYISVNDLALLTGLSERTVWRRLQANAFPFVLRSGRVTTIHRASALRVLKYVRVPSVTAAGASSSSLH